MMHARNLKELWTVGIENLWLARWKYFCKYMEIKKILLEECPICSKLPSFRQGRHFMYSGLPFTVCDPHQLAM